MRFNDVVKWDMRVPGERKEDAEQRVRLNKLFAVETHKGRKLVSF